MQILMIATALRKEYGGPPIAVVGAATALSDLGNDVTLMIFGQSKKSIGENQEFFEALILHKVRFITTKKNFTSIYGGIGNFSDIKRLWIEIKKAEVLSLHALYNFQNLIASLFCVLMRKPFTLMPHGTLTIYQRRVHKSRKLLIDPIFRLLVLRPSSAIFVATPVEKEEIPDFLFKKTEVVGLGLPSKTQVSFQTNEARNEYVFVYMGRITRKKRLDYAIAAFSEFSKTSAQPTRLVICGDGEAEYVDEMKHAAKELPFSENVIFKGWVSGAEKEEILSKSDCFLLTSEDENFAIAVAEALSHGLPCVLSKAVALSEIVSRYKAGIVFDSLLHENIVHAMKIVSQSDREQLRMNAIEASQELDWDFVSLRWQDALSSAIEAK